MADAAAWQVYAQLVSAAGERYTNDAAAAGVAWTAAEATAAKTYADDVADDAKTEATVIATAWKAYDGNLANQEKTLSEKYAESGRAQDEAYADAAANQAFDDWPAWKDYQQATSLTAAMYFGAVANAYRDYQIDVSAADKTLTLAILPSIKALAVHRAEVHQAAGVRSVELMGDMAADRAIHSLKTSWNKPLDQYARDDWNDYVPEWLDPLTQGVAGWADAFTFGEVMHFNEWAWGDIARRNHQGTVFEVGRFVGMAHQLQCNP